MSVFDLLNEVFAGSKTAPIKTAKYLSISKVRSRYAPT